MTDFSTLMKGKRGLVMGCANERSIAWGIAQSLYKAGAEMAFTYQNEALKKRVTPMAEQVGVKTLIECDVTSEESLDKVFETLER